MPAPRKRSTQPLPHLTGFPATHADLERAHNDLEHARHAHTHGREYDSVGEADTVEPWPDYDLAVMPRGV
jgi:hypothetical protein